MSDIKCATGDNKAIPLVGDKEYNILLLGEKDVGKSTFIKACCNYLTFTTLEDAIAGKPVGLIPSNVTVGSDYDVETIVEQHTVGNSSGEVTEKPTTRTTESFIFYQSKKKIRLIDTPGISNNNREENNKIFDNILKYIRQLESLDAICIFVKSDESTGFKDAIHYLLSKFDRSAIKRIFFVFTHLKDSFDMPGNAILAINIILDEICTKFSVRIPFGEKNVFCIDSAIFQRLVAFRDNFKFPESEQAVFKSNWKFSAKESTRMILNTTECRFASLTPHRIQSIIIIIINEVRCFIRHLAISTVNAREIFENNLIAIKKQKRLLHSYRNDQNPQLTVMNVRRKDLPYNVIVCTSSKCQGTVNVNGVDVEHYQQRCHHPCRANLNVHSECTANFTKPYCSACGCVQKMHICIAYETEVYLDPLLVINKQRIIEEAEKTLEKYQKTSEELGKERESILKLIVKLEYYLQYLVIVPYHDKYRSFIESALKIMEADETSANEDKITYLKDLLERYQIEKNIRDECLLWGKSVGNLVVSATIVQNLLSLVQESNKLPDFVEIIKKSPDGKRLEDAIEQWLKTETVGQKC